MGATAGDLLVISGDAHAPLPAMAFETGLLLVAFVNAPRLEVTEINGDQSEGGRLTKHPLGEAQLLHITLFHKAPLLIT
jgi:hypothetical protein